MGLGSPVDVAEQTARPDVGQPGPGVDGDLAQTGQVEGEAALGDGRPGDVVAATLDPEEQALVAGEVDGGSDVGGRGRLEDERRGGRGQAVPDPHGLVPAWVTSPQQPALDPPGQVRKRPGGHGHRGAGPSAELDSGRGHRTAPPAVRAASRAARKAAGRSRAGSSPAWSTTRSGQPWRALAASATASGTWRSWRPQMRLAGTGMRSRSAAGMAGRAKAGIRPAMAASMTGVVARSRA